MKEKDILSAFDSMMDGKRGFLAPIIYNEADEKEEEKGGKTQKEEDLDMDFEAPKEKGKDNMDEADDVLKDIDLKSMSNDAKIELISNIIQVLQDSVENDDEFSEYMNQILEVVDGYKFDKEGEEEEKEAKKAKRKAGKKKGKEEEAEETGEEGETMPEETSSPEEEK